MRLWYKAMGLTEAESAAHDKIMDAGPLRVDAATGKPVWPIDEFLSAVRIGVLAEAKLRRLNPDGVVEGELPKGVTAVLGEFPAKVPG